ncbi:hypothetical protein PCIT_a2845 [Pseudoalteromonas citrea]|uniref:Cupin type-2 domain-containing protein n=2 Tax=Pseudoalteromonas citrea TaxID=43655 RepID=A0AAD4AHX0_9GAMM|nr:cupin domain-containing protein [Pseudoalteromonas citrea]KAF7769920.1 hypothetical protein PCIT_a2845 [Pseudoalteromonas citrea]
MDTNFDRMIVRTDDMGVLISSMGNTYRMILTGEETAGRFSIMEAFVNPGEGGGSHIHHHEDESFLITEGEVIFYEGERRVVANVGTFIMCPPGVKRAFRNESDDIAKMMIFYTPPGIENMIKLDGKSVTEHLIVPYSSTSNKQYKACSQLSKKFGIEDLTIPFPDIKLDLEDSD